MSWVSDRALRCPYTALNAVSACDSPHSLAVGGSHTAVSTLKKDDAYILHRSNASDADFLSIPSPVRSNSLIGSGPPVDIADADSVGGDSARSAPVSP